MNLLKVLWILVVAFLNLSCGWGSNDDFKEEERPPSSSLSKTTAPIISNLPHLPEEIWVKIFKGLSQKDWYHFQYASKEFYSIALNPLLSWCKTFQERKDKILSNTPAEEIWKEYHAAKYGRRQYYLSIA